MCVCVLHTYRRVKQLTVKIKSNNRAPLTLALTHRPSHSRTHARTLQLTASHAAHLFFSLSLTLSHSSTMKAIELNHCRWQFSAICLVVVVVGGGHFNRRRRRRRHNKLQRSATHGRAQRSAALLVLADALAALPFRISHSTS